MKWYVDVLGFRFMARTVLDEAPISVFSVLTTNEKSHDLGVVLDGSSRAGRVNHYAFWVDTREELLIAADVLGENGYPIEYGPSIHGIGEQNFLYYREPSSLRIELNTGGYRNYVPDWEAEHLEAVAGLEQLLPQQRDADVDDRVVPARRRSVARPRRACPTRSRTRCSTPTPSTARADRPEGRRRPNCVRPGRTTFASDQEEHMTTTSTGLDRPLRPRPLSATAMPCVSASWPATASARSTPDDLGAPDLNAFLAAPDWDRLAALATSAEGGWMPLADVTLTAPVEPRQVLQTGANYRQHVIELVAAGLTNNSDRTPEEAREFAAKMMDDRAANGEPYFFIGLPACVVGDDVPLVLPAYSEVHDWELELAVVIGREAFRVSREDALDHVAGYTIVNDITTRDLVFRKDMKEIGTDWYRAKNAPGLPADRTVPRAGAVRRRRRPHRAARAQRRGHAGRLDQRPAVRHPRARLGRVADDAAAARRPPAHRQPRRQRPALEAVPARRRRHDGLDLGPRHPGRPLRRGGVGGMTAPSENPADLDRSDPEGEIARARRGVPQLGPLG